MLSYFTLNSVGARKSVIRRRESRRRRPKRRGRVGRCGGDVACGAMRRGKGGAAVVRRRGGDLVWRWRGEPTKLYEKGYHPVNVRGVGSNYTGPRTKKSS